MRLPWPSRRSNGRSTGGTAAPAAVGDGAQSSALPVGRSEWREVGALRPTFAADPGIRVQRFRDALAGSRLPAPILRPLGHERSADGPAGLVSGITRPVIARVMEGSRGTGSLPLARKRPGSLVGDDGPAVLSASVAAEPSPTTLPPVQPRRVATVPGTPVVAQSMVSAWVPAGSNALSSIAAGPASARALQTADAPLDAQTKPLSPSGQAPITSAGSPDAVPPVRTFLRSPGGSRVRLGPPIPRTAMTGPASDPMVAPAASTPELATLGTVARTVDGQHGPALAAPDGPLSGNLRPTFPGTPVSAAGFQPSGGWATPRGLVLARVVADLPAHEAGASDAPASTQGLDATLAPTVGSLPLTPTSWPLTSGPSGAGTGRDATQDTSTVAHAGGRPSGRAWTGPAATPGAAPGRAAVQRSTTGTSGVDTPARQAAVSPNNRPARGMTLDGHVTIPATVGPLDHGQGRAVLAHELVHLQQQRSLGNAMPAPGSESAHRLEAAARTAEAHASWQDLSLARPLSRPVHDAQPVTVTRPVRIPSTSPLHAAMQLAEGDPPPPAADSTGTAAATAAATAGAAQGGGGIASAGSLATQLSDRDMDEMLRKLYPRLRRHLSSELLVARERAGVLADLR